jgi:hypothetical protein
VALLIVMVVGGVLIGTLAGGIAWARREGLDGQAAHRAGVRRELMRVPQTPIAQVKEGEKVRIRGRAVARGPLRTSPVSQRTCICFRLTIDSGRGEWHRVFEQDEFDSFMITDDSGTAVLHAPFQLELSPYDARSEIVPQVVFDIAKLSGANITMFGSPDDLRYVETVLRPGDEIIAVGRATLEVDPAGDRPTPRDQPIVCHLNGTELVVAIADADEP